jgi:hypothetical protein
MIELQGGDRGLLPSGEIATRTGPLCGPPTGMSPMRLFAAVSTTVIVWPSEFAM